VNLQEYAELQARETLALKKRVEALEQAVNNLHTLLVKAVAELTSATADMARTYGRIVAPKTGNTQ